MKKTILLIAFALFAFTYGQAQEAGFGVKGGVNIAGMGGSKSSRSRASFHVGVVSEIPLSYELGLQLEALYSSEGAASSGFGGDLILDYVRIPVLGKYYFSENFSGEIGPSFGFLMKAEAGGNQKLDIKDRFRTFDAGLALGATYRLDMGLFFGIRFNKGLMDVQKDFETGTYREKSQSNVLQASAGFIF